MATIHNKTFIDAPIEKVYSFARNPERWHTWWVGLHLPDKITGHGEPGTIVKHNFTMAGIAFPLTSKVLEDRPGPKKAHWKGEFQGPITGHHTWNYTAKGEGTEVTLDLEYTVPGRALGQIADRLVIEKLQEKAMQQTLENLKIVCEAEVPATTTR